MTCLNLKSLKLLSAILCLCLLGACNKEEVPLARINLETFSPEEQTTIGARLQDAVLNDSPNFPLLSLDNAEDQKALEDYVNSLIKTVAITAPVVNRNFYNWNVTIVHDDDERNLFTVPGGHFFVYTGLLRYLESESELLALLAHEMMYIDKDLTIGSLKEEFGGNAMSDLLLGKDVAEIDNMGLWLRDVKYSEVKVIEADAFAIDIICPFLYHKGGLKSVIERVKDNAEANVAWAEKRPSAINRLDEMERILGDCGHSGGDLFTDRYQSMIAKLP